MATLDEYFYMDKTKDVEPNRYFEKAEFRLSNPAMSGVPGGTSEAELPTTGKRGGSFRILNARRVGNQAGFRQGQRVPSATPKGHWTGA